MRLKTLTAGLVSLATMASAQAALAAQDYVIILLDATGSMSQDGRWNNAISNAKATVQSYITNFENNISRGFAVYTFKTDATQNGIKQVWPTAATTCTKETPTGASTTFCAYPADDLYVQLLGAAGAGSPLGELDGVISTYGPPDGGPRTPLALSMCDTITAMKQAAGNINATIVLESDGFENETPSDHLCGGPDANVPQSFVFNNGAPDRGYPLVDGEVSWQAKVLRRYYAYNTPPSSITNLSTPVPGNATFPNQLSWKVTAHYTFYPADSMQMQLLLAPSASSSQLSAFSLPDSSPPTFTQQLLRAAAGYSQPATLQLGAGSTSMPRGEIQLFSALGKATPRSRYKEIVNVSGQPPVYGVNHRVPGDVDDSGCSDIADYRIITQRDVWLQRAVRPLEIAIRADLNRDGWVDRKDIDVLLANWGRGCINPVQPPPR